MGVAALLHNILRHRVISQCHDVLLRNAKTRTVVKPVDESEHKVFNVSSSGLVEFCYPPTLAVFNARSLVKIRALDALHAELRFMRKRSRGGISETWFKTHHGPPFMTPVVNSLLRQRNQLVRRGHAEKAQAISIRAGREI